MWDGKNENKSRPCDMGVHGVFFITCLSFILKFGPQSNEIMLLLLLNLIIDFYLMETVSI